MRQEMSKTNDQGPKQVDKTQYQEMMKEHASQHAESIKIAATGYVAEASPVREAWRRGDVEALAAREAERETLAAQAQNILLIEEKKLSKHAKRRANKKKKIVVSGGVDQEDEYQPGEEEAGGDQQ